MGTVRVLHAVLTCLSRVIDRFIHLDEGACASPADQDLLLFIYTEVVAIGDAQVDSAHLLAACRLGDLGHKRGVTRLAGSRRRQDGIRTVLFSSLLLPLRPASSTSYSEGQHRVSPQWPRAVSLEAQGTTPLHLGQILDKRKREPVLAQKLCLPLHRATVRACME